MVGGGEIGGLTLIADLKISIEFSTRVFSFEFYFPKNLNARKESLRDTTRAPIQIHHNFFRRNIPIKIEKKKQKPQSRLSEKIPI